MRRLRTETFTAEEAGRVDRIASSHMPRSVFSQEGVEILVGGCAVKKSHKVKVGDEVRVSWSEEVMDSLEGEDIKLDVLYEDEAILVVDKPAGMVVHPGAGNWSGTLVNALLYRYGDDFSTSDEDEEGDLQRPGIVHRLDKDTSGVMVIARTGQAHRALCRQFAEHTNEKVYIAVAKGRFTKRRGMVEKNIMRDPKDRKRFTVTDDPKKGKSAVTHYTVLHQTDDLAFLRIRIETGRTHQIRVHMKSLGHPILGDPIYSRPDSSWPDVGLCLHALRLSFDHPVCGVRMSFTAPLPQRIREVVRLMRGLPRSPEGRG